VTHAHAGELAGTRGAIHFGFCLRSFKQEHPPREGHDGSCQLSVVIGGSCSGTCAPRIISPGQLLQQHQVALAPMVKPGLSDRSKPRTSSVILLVKFPWHMSAMHHFPMPGFAVMQGCTAPLSKPGLREFVKRHQDSECLLVRFPGHVHSCASFSRAKACRHMSLHCTLRSTSGPRTSVKRIKIFGFSYSRLRGAVCFEGQLDAPGQSATLPRK
jgi:hypothetical protein